MVLHSSLNAAVADAHRRDLLVVARRHRAEAGPNAGEGSILRRIARAVTHRSVDGTEPVTASGPGAEKWSANRRHAVPR